VLPEDWQRSVSGGGDGVYVEQEDSRMSRFAGLVLILLVTWFAVPDVDTVRGSSPNPPGRK
jgi:hypothetical protein